jgi:hypothetical protein
LGENMGAAPMALGLDGESNPSPSGLGSRLATGPPGLEVHSAVRALPRGLVRIHVHGWSIFRKPGANSANRKKQIWTSPTVLPELVLSYFAASIATYGVRVYFGRMACAT